MVNKLRALDTQKTLSLLGLLRVILVINNNLNNFEGIIILPSYDQVLLWLDIILDSQALNIQISETLQQKVKELQDTIDTFLDTDDAFGELTALLDLNKHSEIRQYFNQQSLQAKKVYTETIMFWGAGLYK